MQPPHWNVRRICCIGAGYVGAPHGAAIAHHNSALEVTVVDLNGARIAAWKSDSLPIYEPDLERLVKLPRDGDGISRKPNLSFTTDVESAVAEADMIFLAINTPTKATGQGMGRALDLAFVESAVRTVAKVSRSNKIIVEKSTVPCRTAESIRDVLSANARPGISFEVLSNPEFLAEGNAVADLVRPDRILIGSSSTPSGYEAAKALADIYAGWVPRQNIFTTNLWSSELAKLAANALLAQRISSINSLSAICEATGADIDEVSYAVGLDKRIGPRMLKSSIGFGGSCFKKDVLCLVYLAESLNLPEVAVYWKSVIDINEWQKDRFARRVISSLHNTLYNKNIAIFGFAYKKDTADTRETAAISIVGRLLAEHAIVSIYDPQVTSTQIHSELRLSSDSYAPEKIQVYDNAVDACKGASAIVVVTEWDEFRTDTLDSHEGNAQSGPLPLPHDSNVESANFTQANGNSPGDTLLKGDHVVSPTSNGPKNSAQRSSPNRVDWRRISEVMSRPMFVFDGRNIIDRKKLLALGFRVESIGVR